MPHQPQIIDYAKANTATEIHVRRDGDWITIVIPASSLSRTILVTAIRASFFVIVLVLAFAIAILMKPQARRSDLLRSGIPLLFISITAGFVLIPAARAALAGSRPTIIQANQHSLQLLSRGLLFRQRTWHTAELMDIRATERHFLPVLARGISFQVMLQTDRVEEFQIPWNGRGPLASIEDNLQDVLHLPRSPLRPNNL